MNLFLSISLLTVKLSNIFNFSNLFLNVHNKRSSVLKNVSTLQPGPGLDNSLTYSGVWTGWLVVMDQGKFKLWLFLRNELADND